MSSLRRLRQLGARDANLLTMFLLRVLKHGKYGLTALHKTCQVGSGVLYPAFMGSVCWAEYQKKAMARGIYLASNSNAFPIQLVPDLVSSVDQHVVLQDLVNLRQQGCILFGKRTTQLRCSFLGSMATVA